jgi:hypothetical protein
MTPSIETLRRRIRLWVLLFIIGLVLSGATAIPLETELNWLVQATGAEALVKAPASTSAPDWAVWLVKVREALVDTNTRYPFLAYGCDWLAFGHFVIAIAFIGAWRDPVRNRWLFDFGLIACVLVIPYALVFGGVRGIPIWWRMIDASFGVFGAIPVLLCRRMVTQLEDLSELSPDANSVR